MRAIRFREYGGPEVVSLEDVPVPDRNDDELTVRVEAAGVNPIDWLVRNGELAELIDDPPPWIPGWDFSGVVEGVGEGVTGYDPGDEVYGMTRLPDGGSTWAEYATVRPLEARPKPPSLTHVEAAAVPQVAMTAAHALFEAADVAGGDRVLIHAAAGGVGHFAVQFASHAGAEVVGTASAGNEAFLRDLGVDEFVDYREQRFEAVVDPVDVVVDGVGGDVLERSGEVTREGGVIVTLPVEPPTELVERLREDHGVETRFFSLLVDSDPELLDFVTEHLESGTVEPTVSNVYPLAEAREALEESEAGHVRGKLVLDVPHGE